MNCLRELFLGILNMSITASIVIGVVLVLRLLLSRAPKGFSYLLWGIVLIRLLCPISLPSHFSVLDLWKGQTTDRGSVEYFSAAQGEVSASFQLVSGADEEELPPMDIRASVSFQARMLPIFAGIWLLGVAVMTGYGILAMARVHRKTTCSVRLRENIYLADHIPSPFVLGLLKPRIYLPFGLAGKEQEYILLHEQYHIRRRDYLVKLLAFAALCLHWFNPLVWLAFILAGRDMEISCDEAVMKKTDHDVRQAYAGSLLQLATGRKLTVGIPLAFGEGTPKKRIKNIMSYKKPAVFIGVAAAVVCIIAAICLLTNPTSNQQSVEFQAKIIQIGNGTMLVEPAAGSGELASSDQFSVPIQHMAPSPEPQVGDLVEISYNGIIMESYPAQLGEIYQIKVIEEGAGSSGEPEALMVPPEEDLSSVTDHHSNPLPPDRIPVKISPGYHIRNPNIEMPEKYRSHPHLYQFEVQPARQMAYLRCPSAIEESSFLYPFQTRISRIVYLR